MTRLTGRSTTRSDASNPCRAPPPNRQKVPTRIGGVVSESDGFGAAVAPPGWAYHGARLTYRAGRAGQSNSHLKLPGSSRTTCAAGLSAPTTTSAVRSSPSSSSMSSAAASSGFVEPPSTGHRATPGAGLHRPVEYRDLAGPHGLHGVHEGPGRRPRRRAPPPASVISR